MAASLASQGRRNFHNKIFLAFVAAIGASQVALAAPGLDFNPLKNQLNSLQKLQMALQDVQITTSVRELLDSSTLNSLTIAQKVEGAGVQTVKFQHYVRGIEVVGSRVTHHWGKDGPKVRDMLSRFDLSLDPAVSAETAVSIARGNVGDREISETPELKVLPSQDDNSARLVHWVKIKSQGFEPARQVIVDAHSGDVIADISEMLTIAPIQVYNAKDHGTTVDSETRESHPSRDYDHCQLIDSASGYPIKVDPENCEHVVQNGKTKPAADKSARNAADNSTHVLTYYKTKHERDSFDNRGTDAVSVVHVGNMFQNAAWMGDQKIMIYGDGDGKFSLDFTAAVDVAGHEMTHGVVGETARFNYFGQSGALNEAFADFFGKMIENEGDWVVGRKLFPTGANKKGFRDLSKPSNFTYQYREKDKTKTKPYPAHMNEIAVAHGKCDDTNDYCYVHINSTVPSHAAYLVLKAIGQEKAEKLFYTALTQYLSSNDDFKHYSATVTGACNDIPGLDHDTCEKVKNAFAQVGL